VSRCRQLLYRVQTLLRPQWRASPIKPLREIFTAAEKFFRHMTTGITATDVVENEMANARPAYNEASSENTPRVVEGNIINYKL
jgi:hypothetical protein